MNRYLSSAVATVALASSVLLSDNCALARGHEEAPPQNRAQQQSQMQAFKQQQVQERSGRENEVRAQEENARNQQQQAARQQQEQAQRAQQNQARDQERQQQRQAQEQMRQQQQQAQKMEEQQQRESQRQQQQAAQKQMKEQQAEARQQERQAGRTQEENRQERPSAQMQPAQERNLNHQEREARGGFNPNENLAVTTPERGAARAFNQGGSVVRPQNPRPLNLSTVPLAKARALPTFDDNLSPDERQHAQAVINNMQAHMTAVPPNLAPQNMPQVSEFALNSYVNNYPAFINNQSYIINRANTFFQPVPQFQYPYWYQPSPGWAYSNGFVLGNSLRVGLDWLGWGWHPYYGPAPEGFVCAQNYIPTPWVYFPAAGLWRVAGMPGWAPSGPPWDYTGPISVEVLEPRRVNVSDPYTGFAHERTINVIYLYNAFFYPEFERYGYSNRHNYFVWLNP